MMKYISFAVMLITLLVLLSSSVMAAGDVEIALEAELADKIQGPIAIGVPADAKAQGGPEPGEPSNGKFIWAPGPPVTGGGGSGYAEYRITLPADGTYAIWGHVISWDGNSDSFWVTWQPVDPAENPQQTQNTQFRWSTGSGNNWYWQRVNAWLNAGTVQREWEFESGETILRIWGREDATMLDALYITNDILGGEASKRLPTDEDRALQIQGSKTKAVDAAGKLFTTWGSIRSRYAN